MAKSEEEDPARIVVVCKDCGFGYNLLLRDRCPRCGSTDSGGA